MQNGALRGAVRVDVPVASECLRAVSLAEDAREPSHEDAMRDLLLHPTGTVNDLGIAAHVKRTMARGAR